MIKYFLLLLLPLVLFASKILSYNIYERTDRDDIMITFDTPYSGVIKQSLSATRIVIKLTNASIESSKIKNVNSSFLHSIHITPMKNQTNIVASVAQGTKLIVSKTSDSYGLRLRFLSSKVVQKNKKTMQETDRPINLSQLPTKKEIKVSTSYYVVVSLLIIAIIILLVFKKKMQLPQKNKKQNSWLFKETQNQVNDTSDTNNISIRFEKSITDSTSVVMLDFGSQSYLLLLGNSNILLEKFEANKPKSQEEFNTILQSRHEELEQFLDETQEQTTTSKEPLQSYKERAASLLYGE